MRIFLTGSSGYVGKSIFKALCDDCDIFPHNRSVFDLTDTKAVTNHFKKNQYDVVIHAAASGGSRLQEDEQTVLYNNLKSFYNLYDNKHGYNRFITFGSGAEFSDELTQYSLSKRAINAAINNTDNFYNIRIYAVFDENEKDTRFIKSCIRNYLAGNNMVIHQNKYMDFFGMDDLTKLVRLYCTDYNPKKVIDCSYKQKYSLCDIAEYINSLGTHKSKIDVLTSQIGKSYIGFSDLPPYMLFDGLHKSIDKMFNVMSNQ